MGEISRRSFIKGVACAAGAAALALAAPMGKAAAKFIPQHGAAAGKMLLTPEECTREALKLLKDNMIFTESLHVSPSFSAGGRIRLQTYNHEKITTGGSFTWEE